MLPKLTEQERELIIQLNKQIMNKNRYLDKYRVLNNGKSSRNRLSNKYKNK